MRPASFESNGHPLASVPAPRPSIFAIFSIFFRIGLFSFGGGLTGWVYREVVVVREWLSEDEFMSGLAMSQILPGTNISNLSIYIGQKLRGVLGAGAAIVGLLSGPFFAVIAVASAYGALKTLTFTEAAMGGVAAAAIGMLLVIGVHHWITTREFVELFAISRTAPGPGSMLATLIGWHIFGWTGALNATLALFVPSSLLCYGVALI